VKIQFPHGCTGSNPVLGVMKITIEPEKKCKLCTCGKSKILPYCDDTHREINEKNSTNFKSIKLFNKGKQKIDLEVESKIWE
jgi:CDGSH-type Zn-finger protein